MHTLAETRHRFNSILATIVARKATNAVFLSRDKYVKIMNHMKEIKSNTRAKTPSDYHRMKRYDVIKEKLVYPLSTTTTATAAVRYYVCTDELFDVIHPSTRWPNTHRERATKDIQEHHNGSCESVPESVRTVPAKQEERIHCETADVVQ